MRKFLAFILLGVSIAHGQSIEELKSAIQKKKDSIAQIEKRVNGLKKDLDSMIKVQKHDSIYQWEKGAFGTLGTSFSGFNNWLAQKIPSNRSSNILLADVLCCMLLLWMFCCVSVTGGWSGRMDV